VTVKRRLSGTLKWFDRDEGYGYITPDDGGGELFFTYAATWGGGFKDLEKGERVTYEVGRGLARATGGERLQVLSAKRRQALSNRGFRLLQPLIASGRERNR
jgi:cold shock protein